MKHLVRLLLVVALMTGVACADYLYIEPSYESGPIVVTAGEIVEYEVYWHIDASREISGFDIQVGYDSNELTFVDPTAKLEGLGDWLYPNPPYTSPMFDPFRAAMNPSAEDDDAGLLHFYLLLVDDFQIVVPGPTDVLLARLPFEVNDPVQIWDQLSDCWILPGTGIFGIIVDTSYDGQLNEGEYVLMQYDGDDGASVGDIPEPTTMALLGIGLLGALLRKRN